MKNIFTGKNIIHALGKSILFFASFHIILLFIASLINHDLMYVNVFYILGLNSILPHWYSSSTQGHILSAVILAIIYSVFFYIQVRKK